MAKTRERSKPIKEIFQLEVVAESLRRIQIKWYYQVTGFTQVKWYLLEVGKRVSKRS